MMAYSDSRDSLDIDRGMDDVSLAAGRSQREKKRSYKDLLREEEEIAEQVFKSSKKRSKDTDVLAVGSESHKKKKKHSSDDAYYPELSSSEVKKKKKLLPSSSSPTSDTAMDLLNSISSPLISSSKSSSRKTEKIQAAPINLQSPTQVPRKEHRKKEETAEDLSHKSKRPKPLTLREPEGLRMKLILSPKEKTSEHTFPPQESLVLSDSTSPKKSSKKSSKDEAEKSSHKKHRKESHAHRPCETPDSASSSGGDLETGELVIDDTFRDMKKKKKSKKSKKKKDKHKEERHKKHSKSKREHGLESSPASVQAPLLSSPPSSIAAVSPPPITQLPQLPAQPPPAAPPPLAAVTVVSHLEGTSEKKKKKKEVDKMQPKKKNMSAYQVFSKEYRGSIIAEHPGIDFGELSKKLAEVWKQLPEKDKLVWKQKAQYLQHKQNKAEATTVKRKSSPSESSSKTKGSSGLSSPHKKSPSSLVSFSSSPAKVPDTEPIDLAAHLQLLGESLSLIGHRLQETEGMVAVSGSLSVLLDSILCAMSPLVCLTSHVPELNGCPKQVLSNTLDNIAYVMPGL
ncbi:HMG domain-containing protein 4 [Hyla sarda]|uniref:HMG domain-containing protein 4 n=1 Tax=Hyla sarda TaxID=327740 RepID=UPI0024C2187A|nr:HMG domain-containing protein 4 [Hyla sarda]XP_056379962.1 HMG domain-containing protein 4 [Hyla sarda]